jgi:hypothetical protein
MFCEKENVVDPYFRIFVNIFLKHKNIVQAHSAAAVVEMHIKSLGLGKCRGELHYVYTFQRPIQLEGQFKRAQIACYKIFFFAHKMSHSNKPSPS